MKQLTLLQVCKLPDVQIHSKTSFLKKIINQDTPQVLIMRQNIAKLSYTIKVIGVKDDQVGIMSKRVPLKYKAKQNPTYQHHQFQSIKSHGFLPHQTFYSAPLGPVSKKQKIIKPKQGLLIVGNSQFQFGQSKRVNTDFKKRVQSMSNLRGQSTYSWKNEKNKNFVIPKINTVRENKTSYSKMLNQMSANKRKIMIMNPIRHEQNPLFKRIKKINKLTKIQQDGSLNKTSYLKNFNDPQKEEFDEI